MAIEVPIHEVTLKEEGMIELFRANPQKFGRGYSDGAKWSVPHEIAMSEGIFAMAQHTIETARAKFPNVDDVQGKDYELGVVVGVWASMKQYEVGVAENPHLKEMIDEQGGIPA